MEERTRCWRVSGKVQGVGFRAATRREALSLGLHGRASNLADGSVMVCARGAPALLEALQSWLQHGPRFAIVTMVDPLETTAEFDDGFSIG